MALKKDEWEQRYIDGNLPWDRSGPSEHLAWAIETFKIAPGRAVDIGCGTGTNVIWLAENGFDATGVDIAEHAIEKARAKVDAAGAKAELAAVDFLNESVPGGPFALAFDRGCFHSFDLPDDRATFAARVADLLEPDGLWVSLIGSTDAPPREVGPPQRSARDITTAVEDRFRILLLEATILNPAGDAPNSFPAWRCVMRKR